MSQGPQVDIAALTDRGKRREANEDGYSIFRVGRYAERIDSSVPESDLPTSTTRALGPWP